jgi:hypothetical protein
MSHSSSYPAGYMDNSKKYPTMLYCWNELIIEFCRTHPILSDIWIKEKKTNDSVLLVGYGSREGTDYWILQNC